MVVQQSPSLIPNSMNDAGGSRARDQVKETDGDGHLKSRILKRSLLVGGHKNSVSLEDVFWGELRAMAKERHVTLSQLAGKIDSERQHCNLSSAIRLFVFEYIRSQAQAAHRQDKPVSD
jgi:predicted DNA-binding ribbon-helix-helix protein